jgi:GNAT superfamily N-acetyltransferase
VAATASSGAPGKPKAPGKPVIRPGRSAADARAAFALIEALAVHEACRDDLKITADAFIAAATGDAPKLRFLVAELDGAIVGVATYIRRFHIWNNSDFLHLDDLYVSAAARGHGIGTRLLTALGQTAKAEGLPVKWEVNAGNAGGLRLYRRIGARVTEKGICWWPPEALPE